MFDYQIPDVPAKKGERKRERERERERETTHREDGTLYAAASSLPAIFIGNFEFDKINGFK